MIPHNWVKKGKYGGSLRMMATSTTDGSIGEWWYAHSPVRFLNDGADVGPGLGHQVGVERRRQRVDLHPAQGHQVVRRPPGHHRRHPVLVERHGQLRAGPTPSSRRRTSAKSGKGTICKLTAKDAGTFTMTFDSPAPLTVDRMAMWTNGYRWATARPGSSPPTTCKNFHPKYNKNTPKDWTAEGGFWQVNCGTRRSTKCPTLNPFRLTKYSEGRSLSWERNPYCYEVTKDGDQLPYVDKIQHGIVSDPQVGKVQMGNGQIDLSFGGFNGVALSDVATLQEGDAEVQARGPVLGRWRRHGLVDLLQPGLHREEVPRPVRRDRSSSRPCRSAYNRERGPQVDLLRAGRDHHRHDEPQGHRVPRQRRGREDLRRLA